jgi:hypothetical protein
MKIINQFVHNKGSLNLGDQFISLRLIKEKLEKHNRISILEETSSYIKCKVFRILRIFGGPWIGPYPILFFRIERKQKDTIVHYDFYWPEYYAAVLSSVAFGFVMGYCEYETADIFLRIKIGFLFFIACVFVSSVFIFLDIKYYSRILHKELKGL